MVSVRRLIPDENELITNCGLPLLKTRKLPARKLSVVAAKLNVLVAPTEKLSGDTEVPLLKSGRNVLVLVGTPVLQFDMLAS